MRKPFLDLLAVVSCFGVVALHCNGVFWNRPQGFTWWSANAIESIFYFSAPVFFMISGATLMEYRRRYDTRELFRRRLVRVFIPFAFWSLVSYGINCVKNGFDGLSLLRLPYDVLTCRYMHIYWFFLPLFTWYFTVPLFSLLVGRKKLLLHLILIGLIANSLYPFCSRIGHFSANEGLLVPAVSGVTVLMLIGYYLSAYELSSKCRLLIYIAGGVGLIVHFVGTHIASGESVSHLFKGYTTPLCIAYSSAVFVMFKHMRVPNAIANAVGALRKETFGVYLMHGFVVYLVMPGLFNAETTGTLLFRLSSAICTFFACAIVSRLLHRYKLTSWIV